MSIITKFTKTFTASTTKKKLIIFVVFILPIVMAVYYSINERGNQESAHLIVQEQSKNADNSINREPTFKEIPKGDTIEVSEVKINNFFNDIGIPEHANFIELEKNDDYQIVFLNDLNQFLITITGSPFVQKRTLAENKLLSILDIDQEAACKLDMSLGTPIFANPDQAGVDYQLSFCE